MANESDSDLIRGTSEREHVRVVALVQARMGFARLPGKVLKPIAGQPLLWHIVHRLKTCRLLEDIAVVTSSSPADDAIVEWCNTHSVTVVRGPENDALAAQARAAERLDADIIVQASCDAPFIDAGLVDHLVATLIEQDGDYVVMGEETGQEGIEAFSRRALDRLMMDAAHDPAARAQVTGYFRLHPEFVRIVRAGPYGPQVKSDGRLTINTQDDLAFVEAVHARLAAKAGEASLADLLLLLEREPELKALPASPASLRPSGGGHFGAAGADPLRRRRKFGYGHVKRMVALARALRDSHGIGAIFALNGSEDATRPIRRAGFDVTMLEHAFHLENLVRENSPDLLILDGREGPSRAQLDDLKRSVAVTAVIDDGDERRLAADYAYYPPVPGALALNWTGSHALPRIGWEWALLGLNPNQVRKRAPGARPTVLVAMGGSDPHGLTLRMGKALSVLDTAYRIRFVIGTAPRIPARWRAVWWH
jgi:spore coat polysaccharide biosynthesis protein SpsF